MILVTVQKKKNISQKKIYSIFPLQKVDPELIFTKQERIGKGSFGEVFKGIDNRTQQVNHNDNLIQVFVYTVRITAKIKI